MRYARTPAIVESAMPYRGECGLCGGPDARHRIWDAMVELANTGDSAEDIAADYERPVHVVRVILARWNPGSQAWETQA